MVCGPSDDVAGHQDSAADGEEGVCAGGYCVRRGSYDASVRRYELTGVLRISILFVVLHIKNVKL